MNLYAVSQNFGKLAKLKEQQGRQAQCHALEFNFQHTKQLAGAGALNSVQNLETLVMNNLNNDKSPRAKMQPHN